MNVFEGLSAELSVAEIGGHMVDLFGQVWVLVALAIAIPLTFYIIRRLKGIFA